MAQTGDRFIKTYSQAIMDLMEIRVDKETGVTYLSRASGNAGGSPSAEA